MITHPVTELEMVVLTIVCIITITYLMLYDILYFYTNCNMSSRWGGGISTLAMLFLL